MGTVLGRMKSLILLLGLLLVSGPLVSAWWGEKLSYLLNCQFFVSIFMFLAGDNDSDGDGIKDAEDDDDDGDGLLDEDEDLDGDGKTNAEDDDDDGDGILDG